MVTGDTSHDMSGNMWPARVAEGSTISKIVEAYYRCRSRWGTAKTTIDDVVNEAGLSRATFYRVFPDGRSGLVARATDHELAVWLDAVIGVLHAHDSLADGMCAGLAAADRIARTDASRGMTLQQVVFADPEGLLTDLHFTAADLFHERARRLGIVAFDRWLDADDGALVGEWVVRILAMHTFHPFPPGDLADDTYTRDLVENRILRAVTAREAA